MTVVEIIRLCKNKIDNGCNTVSFIVPGKWSNRGYKKIGNVKGEQVAEYEDGILCAFNAKDLLFEIVNNLPH